MMRFSHSRGVKLYLDGSHTFNVKRKEGRKEGRDASGLYTICYKKKREVGT